MKYEKSAGAVVFRELKTQNSPPRSAGGSAQAGKLRTERQYLLLAYPAIDDKNKIYWGFPKGHVAEAELERETAVREIKEETGLSEFSLLEGFCEAEKYFFRRDGELVNKTSVFYLAQTTGDEVKVSFEHLGFEWLAYAQTLERLSFKNSKELLTKAEKFLSGEPVAGQARLNLLD